MKETPSMVTTSSNLTIEERIRKNLAVKPQQEVSAIYSYLSSYMNLTDEKAILKRCCRQIMDDAIDKIITE